MITKLFKEENSMNEIEKIRKSIRPHIIAIDFDDTIAYNSFPDILKATLKDGAKEVINKLYEKGYYIIIWTCRYLENHVNDCINFLNNNGIKFHIVNENYPSLPFKPTRKIYYDILIDDKCMLDVDWNKIEQFINEKIKNDINYHTLITKEMIDWFVIRTNTHINLVQKYCQKISDKYLKYNKFIGIESRGNQHDSNKWLEPEVLPYIIVSWNYHCKDIGKEFYINTELKEKMDKASEHHVLNNSHHPESWSTKINSEIINKDDRDGIPSEIIDAEKMDELGIAEMCADWCAMSEERNNTPKEWADKTVNKRWKFTDKQVTLIYDILNNIW
jgi:hydroxymethylpyrimidine pyrophosphatase-like HAD family hydrolase